MEHEAADKSLYVVGKKIKKVDLRPMTVFFKFMSTSCSGNEMKASEKAQLTVLMFKIKKSSFENDILSISFHRDIETREQKFTNNKTTM